MIVKSLALALFLTPAAHTIQPECTDRASVLRLLAQRYSEAPVASGVTNNGALIEVLSDPKGGTWTIIMTTSQGLSCLIAAGEGWRGAKPKEGGT